MEKQEFKEKAKKSIDDLFAKIEILEQKKEKASAETKARYNKIIADVKILQKDLQAKYKAFENSSSEDWEEKKKVLNSSLESFKEGFSRLSAIFK